MNLRLQILSDASQTRFLPHGFHALHPSRNLAGLFAFRLFVLLSLRNNLKYVEIGRSKL